MKYLIWSILCISGLQNNQAQSYLGAGNVDGITITSSSEFQSDKWSDSASAINVIDGSGLDHQRFMAARFLEQSTIGFEQHDIDDVVSMGIESWIDQQIGLPMSSILSATEAILEITNDSLIQNGDTPQVRPNDQFFHFAWWEVNMTNADLLRHKVACALSEIMVISGKSDLKGSGFALGSYYDVLLEHGLGNYRDLLFNVTMHPAMGYYLSHANNPRSDIVLGRFPDENYAREVMQLFSIGLFELNNDGSRKKQNGADIPTYNNDDIIEYAKVFTGLSYGAVAPETSAELKFGLRQDQSVMTVPMIMYDTDDPNTPENENYHEPGPKYLLRNQTIPTGQSGIQDINDAIDNLFNHPNVGPFISYRLIQRLVKSNPSPGYISRVASKFNNNGSGVRGDMKSVVQAILLDPEARDCSFMEQDQNSRLKEPLFRISQFARMVDKEVESHLWASNLDFLRLTGQAILSSPSVFNFYLPSDAPNGEITDRGLVAPEFQLHDTRLSVGYFNQVFQMTKYRRIFDFSQRYFTDGETRWNYDSLLPIALEVEHYIDWLDHHILHGKMTEHTRIVMRRAINWFSPGQVDYLEERVEIGMYVALISAEYNTNK